VKSEKQEVRSKMQEVKSKESENDWQRKNKIYDF